MARFVQYGKIRVKYDTAYYTNNTPYDTSLVLAYPMHIAGAHMPLLGNATLAEQYGQARLLNTRVHLDSTKR
jgi:hypothetical protein